MPRPNTLNHLTRMQQWMKSNLRAVNAANANSATLLLVCSYIDALGAYNSGWDQEVLRGHTRPPASTFCGFISEYMTGFMAASRSPNGKALTRSVRFDRCAPGCGQGPARKRLDYPAILQSHFRNGVVHEFLPRGWAGYCRGARPYVSWDARKRRLLVNIDHLVVDFEQALDAYVHDVRTKRPKQQLFRKRLTFVLRH